MDNADWKLYQTLIVTFLPVALSLEGGHVVVFDVHEVIGWHVVTAPPSVTSVAESSAGGMPIASLARRLATVPTVTEQLFVPLEHELPRSDTNRVVSLTARASVT
jgi:hypothetical protein